MATTADFTIKKNDNRPDLEAQLKIGGSVVDLSTANSATFHLATKRTSDSISINSAGTITDAVYGKVKYAWAAGDTDLPEGLYYWEWEIEWSNGDLQTFPNNDFKTLRIEDELV